ncbi:DNA repair protein RadC [uncultured Proteiniphilum sp.]|uniref:RadC family protein n=1 Tax=uncultured Proteiniphilum sp. TaxID=497637 RepID=UPI0026154185|nr:DNA repair protein RadC [uncultured Proteiniphilum sp.]
MLNELLILPINSMQNEVNTKINGLFLQIKTFNLAKKLKEIPKSDRPREKLKRKGVHALSNQELLMIILGRGISGIDVRSLANTILKEVEKDPENVNIERLESIKGIGLAKASQILASFEFAKRYLIKEGIRIQRAEDVLKLVEDIRNKKQEYFITFTLNGASNLIERRTVFIGTVTESIIHPREIFADAITDRASGIIFVHNHPMDNPQPSNVDITITKRLCEVAKLLGIEVIDHIIISKDDFFSFQSEGLLNKKEN